MTPYIHDVRIEPLTLNHDHRGWLTELYRDDDQLPHPLMAYVSYTRAGVSRGPHEHAAQTDIFIFLTGKWWVKLWDDRPESPTFRVTMRFKLTKPTRVIVPPGIVHAYANANSFTGGLVINLPDQLYRGRGKTHKPDEIRHETNPEYNTLDISRRYGWLIRLTA